MLVLVNSLLIALAIYAILLLGLAIAFVSMKEYKVSVSHAVPVTIIICARNEEKNIAACLGSLLKQDYDLSLVQLIFINDASNDTTLQKAREFIEKSGVNYVLINNPERYGKKRSIAAAVEQAQHDFIITRDADTYAISPDWLKSLASFYKENPCDMIIAPVALNDNHGLLWALQALENNILTLLAGGSASLAKPFLSSGANLCFTRQAFIKTGSYRNHLHIDSGDDIFFMEELKKIEGSKILYIKCREAIVNTFPMYSLGTLLNQKIRWASKFRWNNNLLNFFLATLVFSVNAGWLFCLIYGFVNPVNNPGTFWFVVGKLLVDVLLLWLASGFIKNKFLMLLSIPVSFVYPLYSSSVAIGSLFVKPAWKK